MFSGRESMFNPQNQGAVGDAVVFIVSLLLRTASLNMRMGLLWVGVTGRKKCVGLLLVIM